MTRNLYLTYDHHLDICRRNDGLLHCSYHSYVLQAIKRDSVKMSIIHLTTTYCVLWIDLSALSMDCTIPGTAILG